MRFDSYQPAVRCSFLGHQQGGGGWTTIHLTSFSVFLNFDDAEKQMMPKMLVQKKWEEMKVSIMEAIENLAKAG